MNIVIGVAGVLIGSMSAYLYARLYWKKQIRAARREVLSDLDKVQEQKQLLEASGRKWLEHRKVLERECAVLKAKVVSQEQHYEQLEVSRQKSLSDQSTDYDQLRQDYESYKTKAWDNVTLALQQEEELEAKNGHLQAENNRLISEIEEMRFMWKAEKSQYEAAAADYERKLNEAYKEPGIDIEEIIRKLFPQLELLRDSIDDINRNKHSISAILHRLQALHNHDFEYSEKVKATGGEWSECKAPHMGMIRLYYRKKSDSPSEKCEVLVSRKKDRKSQKKDMEWLKQQPKKR